MNGIISRAALSRDSDPVSAWIEDNLEGGKIVKKRPMGGSGWSSANIYVSESGQSYFVKESRGRGIEMFLGEAKGLQAMHGEHHAHDHTASLYQ